MKYEVAGDPVSGLRWTRKTTKKIAAELSALGIRVSRKTVAKLLKQMNFSLRTNKKKISNGSPPTRDAQFANITQLRERFSRRGNPILSVDTKKKELVGRFKNPGRVWAQKSDAVNDHDFRSMADGVAIPYGIYDLQSNRGTVYVGTYSNGTARVGGGHRGVTEIVRSLESTLRWIALKFAKSNSALAFAVGTALTGGPPHRSQRALLTHWAPTSGHDAQSLFGIRVQCSMLDDFHQPSVVDGIEESTDVRVEYPVHFLVNRAPLSRQATCRIRSSAFRRSGDRT